MVRYYEHQKRWICRRVQEPNKNEGNMRAKTVSINGTVYDAKTGKPLRLERSGHGTAKSAHDIHARTQHSRTLNRRYVTKTKPQTDASPHAINVTRKTRDARPEATHQSVRRFGNDMVAVKPTTVVTKKAPVAKAAIHHPLVSKVSERHRIAKKQATKSVAAPITPSQVLKKQAIEEATLKMTPKHAKKAPKVSKHRSDRSKRLSIASAAFAFMLFSGYLTYLYMPNLSTRVAAAQAGINAEYPSYQPTGYRLAGPIAYQPGEVSMKFAANAGPATYTLTQRRSAWDSSAVLENYIQPKAKELYSTTQTNGLTIYSYGTHSAWVNGGVLYTIDGDAPLSNEQVQRIAKSL